MSSGTILTLLAIVAALAVVCPLIGRYLAAVFGGGAAPGDRFFDPVERRLFRLLGTGPEREQRWARAASMLAFSDVSRSWCCTSILRLQGGSLPFRSDGGSGDGRTALAFDPGGELRHRDRLGAGVAAGEAAMSHLGPDGRAGGRPVHRRRGRRRGSRWRLVRGEESRRSRGWSATSSVDAVRAVVRGILLPLAAPSPPWRWSHWAPCRTLSRRAGNVSTLRGPRAEPLPGGAAGSPRQVVAKTLASDGGGFFNANSAHPVQTTPTGHDKPWCSSSSV